MTRLPDADSLPDGFVGTSGADTGSPSSALIVTHAALNSDSHAATNPGGGQTLSDPSLPASTAEDASSAAAAAEALGTLSLDATAEPEGSLGEQGPARAARGDPPKSSLAFIFFIHHELS